ncbi:hypothetical protein [Methylobacterium sp. E-046]|uniref:hypothetical protein n=1 Tax=Methylobacterium sp. E-046 TaxID=2836576 RepID=UPI001FB888F8|nr:hypothetical protein [Methylobacterium sp. E-046]MCJ2098965.1 hypothetical protein [Methylobacterium sp. E-046]
MSTLAFEVSDGLKALAGPPVEGDRVKARIARAARAAGLPYWRTFDLWYGKARRIDAHEADAIRTARAKRAESASNELTALASDFEALAERLAALAAHSSREESDRARLLAGRVRRLAAGE